MSASSIPGEAAVVSDKPDDRGTALPAESGIMPTDESMERALLCMALPTDPDESAIALPVESGIVLPAESAIALPTEESIALPTEESMALPTDESWEHASQFDE